MSRLKTKQELLDDIDKERAAFEKLLSEIPDDKKTIDMGEGLSVKDMLAHRAEWGRMMRRWYTEAKAGKTPAVPSEKYKWNQLKELNADIQQRFKDIALAEAEQELASVQDELRVSLSA